MTDLNNLPKLAGKTTVYTDKIVKVFNRGCGLLQYVLLVKDTLYINKCLLFKRDIPKFEQFAKNNNLTIIYKELGYPDWYSHNLETVKNN